MAIGNPITLTSNVASKTISVIATAGQTLFTVTGGYRINQLAVFRNGVRLLDSRDYEARNGSTVTLLSAATVGDALEFQVFDDFRVADAIVSAESEQTISGNLTVSGGMTVAGLLTATDISLTDVSLRHLEATGISTVSDTTQSTTTTTGALIVSGGLGVAKNLFVGGSMNVAGTLTYEDVTNSETAGVTTTGGLVVTGLGATFGSGVGIADSIYHIDDSNTAIRFPAADTFTVTTAGSEALRVDSSQRLLVNTDSAMETFGSAALQVATAAGGTLVLGRDDTSVSEDNGLGAIYFDTKAGGSFAESAVIAAEADAAQGSSDYPSRLVFKTTADGAGSVTERVRITSGGRVGVGSVSPNSILDAYAGDGISISNNGDTFLQSRTLNDTGTNYLEFKDSGGGSGAISYHHNGNSLRFKVNGSERLRIDSSGQVGIATNNPVRKLHLHEDSSGNSLIQFTNTTTGYTSGDGSVIGLNSDESLLISNKESGAMFFATSNTNRAYFSSGGTFALVGGGSVASPAVSLNGSAGSDSMILDASGRLLVGTDAARTNFNDSTIESRVQIEAAGDNDSAALSIISNAGTTNSDKRSGLLVLGRTRGTSNGSNTVVVEDDQVGMIEFKGMDGTSFTTAASIKAQVDGSCGADDMPGRLVFSTSADGSGVPTERLRITSAGRIGIGTDDPQGLLVIQGDSNGSTTPSIRLQDGTDSRQCAITNSSGDLILFNSGSDNTPHCKITMFDGNIFSLETTNTERLRVTSVGTFHFKNGAMVENGIVDTTARNGTQAVNLDNGMVHYFQSSSTGTWKPNFRINSTNTLNDAMGTGDIVSPTMIVNKSNTAHYADTIQVDGSDVTPEWLGGAPTDGGGNNTFDVYSYTIIKTGNAAFKCFASVSNYT